MTNSRLSRHSPADTKQPNRGTLEARRSRRLVAFTALLFSIFVVLPSASAIAQESSVSRLLRQIESGSSQRSAVRVQGLRLAAGLGSLVVENGLFIPGAEVEGRVAEFLFLGDAYLELLAPDDIEKHQLTLYTGKSSLREHITEGIVVVALDAASEAILSRPAATLSSEETARANSLWASWRATSERRLLNIDGALLADAMKDSVAEGYFAGWLLGDELGRFIYLVDPRQPEQVTLGRFERIDATEKEKRKASRLIHREQRKGRLIGLEVDDLGQFDTWLSASLRVGDEVRPGDPGFEPAHYQIDVTLTGRDLELDGETTLKLVANALAGRTVPLTLLSDLRVSSAEVRREHEEDFRPVGFHQSPGQVLVFLDSPAEAGETLHVRLASRGVAIESGDGSFTLRDTLGWYPHAGTLDLASYDATFHWPKKYELLAPGKLQEEGTDDSGTWQRRTLDIPSKGYTFEVGRFKRVRKKFGHMTIDLAVDRSSQELIRGEEALLNHVGQALLFLEQTYGELPFDDMQVVTTSRLFSQAMLGFITLSSLMMLDDAILVELGWEDPRTVIAHELAHQWWGHRISWASDRDAWLNEALANWSSKLYQDQLGTAQGGWAGPTDGWKSSLLSKDLSGHPVGVRGPVVLGPRLASSASGDAYQTIVYRKGAVVLQTLARLMGTDAFRKILRWQQDNLAGQTLSTEQFIALLEQGSGLDLRLAAQQLIYGTGVPQINYSYSSTATDAGVELKATAVRKPGYYYRYRVRKADNNRLDVVRETVLDVLTDYDMVSPIVITTAQVPTQGSRSARRRGAVASSAVSRRGFITLTAEETPLAIQLDASPSQVEFDPDEEVLAEFYDDTSANKPTLFRMGQTTAAEGDLQTAYDLFAQTVEAPPKVGDDWTNAFYAARAALERARIRLDSGDLDEASTLIEQAGKLARKGDEFERSYLESETVLARARHYLLAGDPAKALSSLKKSYRQGLYDEDSEALLLIAVAAQQTGDPKLLDELRTKVRGRLGDAAGWDELEGGTN